MHFIFKYGLKSCPACGQVPCKDSWMKEEEMNLKERIADIKASKMAKGWKEHDFYERVETADRFSDAHTWFPFTSEWLGGGVSETPMGYDCHPSTLHEGKHFDYLGRSWSVEVSGSEEIFGRCNTALLLAADAPVQIDPRFTPPKLHGQMTSIRLSAFEVEVLSLEAVEWKDDFRSDPPADFLPGKVEGGLMRGGRYMLPDASPSGVELIEHDRFMIGDTLLAEAALDLHIWRGVAASELTAERLNRLAFLSECREHARRLLDRSRYAPISRYQSALIKLFQVNNIPLADTA